MPENPQQASPQARNIAAIVLAAGLSSRMGDNNKLLAEIGGRPIICHTLDMLQRCDLAEIVVVLGHDENDLRPLLPAEIRVAVNAGYRSGMATSIVCGIRQLGSRIAAAFIVLADMPFVSANTIRAMLRCFDQAAKPAIIVPFYQNIPGNPVLFARDFFPELLMLTGDRGAKPVVQKHPESVVRCECNDPGIHQDIDTAEAYEHLRKDKVC